MQKRVFLSAVLLLVCLGILTGCDPIYPTGKLRVAKIEPLSQETSVDIEIVYPNTGGSIVLDWKEQSIKIINGEDVISISGLTITGLKSGTALIKVSATTVLSDEASKSGYEEKVYSTEVEITVK